jgi:hypothetical protein
MPLPRSVLNITAGQQVPEHEIQPAAVVSVSVTQTEAWVGQAAAASMPTEPTAGTSDPSSTEAGEANLIQGQSRARVGDVGRDREEVLAALQ